MSGSANARRPAGALAQSMGGWMAAGGLLCATVLISSLLLPQALVLLATGSVLTIAGFTVAVTTRKGLLAPRHATAPTALPRLSLNGSYQKLRHVETLLSGVPFSLVHRVTSTG